MATEIFKGLVKRGVSVNTISTKGSSLYSYFSYAFLEIPIKLPRRGVDIYHAVTSPMEGMWLPEDRSVVTYCDTIPILYPNRFGSGMGYSNLKNLIGRKVSKFGWRVASKAKIVACTSEETKEELIGLYNISREKIRILRMGIRNDLEPHSKKDNIFRIGTLGQLDKRKRIDLLIKAYVLSGLEGELVVAGTGMDEPLLRKLDSKGVKFLGMVKDSELVYFYNSLDIFVFPTWVEGYGLPIIEAMACKKPVIVLADAIIPREIKRRCIIVEDLGAALSNIDYVVKKCKEVDYEGNYRFAKSHSWDEYVDGLVEIYKEVLNERLEGL
jgi:glycosyltransferase involved in cell wall biosynthesis